MSAPRPGTYNPHPGHRPHKLGWLLYGGCVALAALPRAELTQRLLAEVRHARLVGGCWGEGEETLLASRKWGFGGEKKKSVRDLSPLQTVIS